MSTLVVHETEAESEALALQQMLEEVGVVCAITSHRDTAYPGIVDRIAGGYEVRVPAEDRERALALIQEFLAGQSVLPLDEAAEADFGARVPREIEPTRSPWRGGSWAFRIVVGALLAFAAWRIFFAN